MAVSASRTVQINYTGDVVGNQQFSAAINSTSPGATDVLTLNSGDNTITVPGGGTTVKGVTIIPPQGNLVAITLKGAGADTGIILSNTDPTSIGFQTAPANFILNAGGSLPGLRLFWS